MKLPLLIKVYLRLRKGWKELSPEAQKLVRRFVCSQEKDGAYLNAGGAVDEYYTQFGKLLQAVFSPRKILSVPLSGLKVRESMTKDTIYGSFFRFISSEMKLVVPKSITLSLPEHPTTNAVCCILAMSYQALGTYNRQWADWLLKRQDTTGGFYSSEDAPIPDLLTTAVALFTLRLIGKKPRSASDFIEAHWLDNGAFTPTIYDERGDVEYMFYGLLALGCDTDKL